MPMTSRAILRTRHVEAETGLSRTHIRRLERSGGFPQRIELGARAVGWFADEVETWKAGRAAARSDHNTQGNREMDIDQVLKSTPATDDEFDAQVKVIVAFERSGADPLNVRREERMDWWQRALDAAQRRLDQKVEAAA